MHFKLNVFYTRLTKFSRNLRFNYLNEARRCTWKRQSICCCVKIYLPAFFVPCRHRGCIHRITATINIKQPAKLCVYEMFCRKHGGFSLSAERTVPQAKYKNLIILRIVNTTISIKLARSQVSFPESINNYFVRRPFFLFPKKKPTYY